jgi:predicted phosphodiesterase
MRLPHHGAGINPNFSELPVKIQIFSDLHLDVGGDFVPPLVPGADVVVCAGDVCEGVDDAFTALRAAIPRPTPIVAVAGNHEFYRRCLPDELDAARRHAPELGITFLENAVEVIHGVRFAAATLWTDYDLLGEQLRPSSMRSALVGLNDHRLISWTKQPWQRFRPQEALGMHRLSRAFLSVTLATPFDGPTVVVTHHAPHRRSIHPRYAESSLNPAFASDLGELIEQHQPDLWIHGHTHTSADYTIGRTRILANPHGYGAENREFDRELLVEVGR